MARVVRYMCDVCGKREGTEWTIIPPEGKPHAVDLCEQCAKGVQDLWDTGHEVRMPTRKYHKFHLTEVTPA